MSCMYAHDSSMTDSHSVHRAPVRSRPLLPRDYGVPEVEDGMVAWDWAVEQLTAARSYWFCTTRPDGRPHAMPAWAVWVDDTLYFDGSPETRRARNLARNSAITVHLESAEQVVVLEGDALEAGKPDAGLAARLVAAFEAKYAATDDYHPAPTTWDNGGLWRLQPRVAFGWTEFPRALTRWRFS